MKIKTKDLIGAALEWAVATALGRGPKYSHGGFGTVFKGWWLTKGGEYREMPFYSTDWKHGGAIIEQEGIQLHVDELRTKWLGSCWKYSGCQYGPTPLVAAMRCFVAHKLGDEIEIPEELC